MFEVILRQNEDLKEYKEGLGVKKLYANQIGSHNPIQDAWGEARVLHSGDVMFGVFDGNNGIACSHVVAKRIFNYATVALLPKEVLEMFVQSARDRFNRFQINRSLQDKHFLLEEYWKTYEESLYSYARDLLERDKELDVTEALVTSFERLDSDLSREALEDSSEEKRMLWVGMTGTCATLVHLSGCVLTTATAGDAMAVVGTRSGAAKVLTPEHNIENAKEVERVRGEHPAEEGVLANGLLLGSLTSFRSFGNFRYKWSRETLEKTAVPVYGKEVVPANCLSPPYLTARPDVGQYRLQPEDAFLVMATDGIWEVFPPDKVVEIICKHRPVSWGKQKLLLPWTRLQKLRKILRKEDVRYELETEKSPATQLILEALETTSKKLHLPRRYIRNIRDDMTVLVVYFDRDYVTSFSEKDDKRGALSKIMYSKLKELFPVLV